MNVSQEMSRSLLVVVEVGVVDEAGPRNVVAPEAEGEDPLTVFIIATADLTLTVHLDEVDGGGLSKHVLQFREREAVESPAVHLDAPVERNRNDTRVEDLDVEILAVGPVFGFPFVRFDDDVGQHFGVVIPFESVALNQVVVEGGADVDSTQFGEWP